MRGWWTCPNFALFARAIFSCFYLLFLTSICSFNLSFAIFKILCVSKCGLFWILVLDSSCNFDVFFILTVMCNCEIPQPPQQWNCVIQQQNSLLFILYLPRLQIPLLLSSKHIPSQIRHEMRDLLLGEFVPYFY